MRGSTPSPPTASTAASTAARRPSAARTRGVTWRGSLPREHPAKSQPGARGREQPGDLAGRQQGESRPQGCGVVVSRTRAAPISPRATQAPAQTRSVTRSARTARATATSSGGAVLTGAG
ncbi:hypothetical protein [Georgenia sp. SUBG003]|uniref:hypothetical protein n=1 Tax=Georgenia sp. SUBG003 TaxID=1497974 RepID=UPI003AB5E4C8